MAMNETKIFCWQNLKQKLIIFFKNVLFFMACIIVMTYHEKIQSMAPWPKFFLIVWWCDILIHIILSWNLVIFMSEFFN